MFKEKNSYRAKWHVPNIPKFVSLLLIGGFLFFIVNYSAIISPTVDRYTRINSVVKYTVASPVIHPDTSSRKSGNNTSNKFNPQSDPLLPVCDFTGHRADNCEMKGDIRIHGSTSQVFIINDRVNKKEEKQTWVVKPYTRKLDKTMLLIREVSTKIVSKRKAPECQVNHRIPAVIFSTRGYTGNYWHDFNDLLVPLFITARQFNGEVQFLVTQMKDWWVGKYIKYFQGMTKYDIIDLDKVDDVHCFPRTIVGLHSHKDFSIDPTKAPSGHSMQDFTKFMRGVYSLERNIAIKLGENPRRKPRLYIIPRKNTRMLMNMDEIVPLAEELGFEVAIKGSIEYTSVKDAAHVINSCDVMMGVHGAGLTNMVFLPMNAVVIQIIPLGKIERLCHSEFGIPAIDMKLKYMAYNITEDESTLLNLYQRDDPVFTDPSSIHKQGWDTLSKIYLSQQNVKLDVKRFRPMLERAIKHLGGEIDS